VGDSDAAAGIYLVVEASAGAAERLSAALGAGVVRSVLVSSAGSSTWAGTEPERTLIRRLVGIAQAAGAAALVADDAVLAKAVGADGVHLSWSPDVEESYSAARRSVGREAIVGASVGGSRHDAMVLAEAGADYVGFARDAAGASGLVDRCEMVAWWAEIFEVPCVAFDVDTADDAEALTAAGADFIASRLVAGMVPADAAAVVEMLLRAVAVRGSRGRQ
jgi:thiamine-phosphate pyrophosphorylase